MISELFVVAVVVEVSCVDDFKIAKYSNLQANFLVSYLVKSDFI